MVEFAPLEFEPAYRKVATALLDRITDRSLNAGDRLPSELELARQFGGQPLHDTRGAARAGIGRAFCGATVAPS